MTKTLGVELNGWKNVVIAVLTTALVTSTTGWFAFGRDTVRKDELAELRRSVTELTKSVNTLSTTVAVLADRLAREEVKEP